MTEYAHIVTLFITMVIVFGMYLYFNQKIEEFHSESAELIRKFTITYKDTMNPLAKEARERWTELEIKIKDISHEQDVMRRAAAELVTDIANLEDRLLKKIETKEKKHVQRSTTTKTN